MVNIKNNNFMPTVSLPPGDTIRENMDYLGMTQKELAVRLSITEKHLSHVLNGDSPITYDTALKLESVIGPSAEFWMKLETNYQLHKYRLEEEGKLEEDLAVLKNIPYRDMAANGWVEKERDQKKKVYNTRDFFGVGSLSAIKKTYAVAFRTHNSTTTISDYGVLAWLRKAEIEGIKKQVEKFDKPRLRKLVPRFRELTLLDPEEFYPELERLCAEAGIALILAEYIPKTYICGATLWRDNRAIVALSMRGKRVDVFWFTFFHEVAHLLNHTRKEVHINFESTDEEDQANEIASNYLISKKGYTDFIENYNFADKDEIRKYAEKIGIATYVLVGRLQHDKLIDYPNYNHLIPSFEIATTKT